ncbi:MAG: gluconate 2-dehydrogenase subunit 3 family protein, partial [Rudaea sp.]
MHPARRSLLKAAAITPAVAVLPVELLRQGIRDAGAATPAYASPPEAYLSKTERAFVEAAVARIIPADDLGPGAKEAGVADFI